MNAGSVQAVPAAAGSQLGGISVAKAKTGGFFGTVLAGMTQTSVPPGAADADMKQNKAVSDAAAVLGAEDIGSLAESLSRMTGIPSEKLLEGLEQVKGSSKLSDWADLLGMDMQEVFETLGPLLEDAGVSKEQLAEIAFSDDIWPLINAAAEHARELAGKLQEMISSKNGETSPQQAVKASVLLKTLSTVLPSKDLLGWQQENLTGLKELAGKLALAAEQTTESQTSVKNPDFGMLLRTVNSASHHAPAVQSEEQSGKANADQPKTIVQALAAVSQTSDNGTNSDKKSEQNHAALLQNPTVQPIVSKNVFSLETPEQKPAGQAEALLAKLQSLFKQTNFGQLGGTNRLLVKLYPEHLGQVRIELVQVNGVMTARILASTALGKEMLDSQLHQLRQSLSQQNVQVDRIDVTQAVQDPSRNDRSQQFSQQQFEGEQEQPEQREAEPEEQQTFQEFLIDLEG
ncbi:flagellar hook-length control protein FliK [Sporosarcina koreensis]|uniref:flagellar hook-length control protein FliK n=1 Tax=Sporosarcina koreensis TaxID=334735 RepID=UPI000694BA0E|nr:flagellar hook-length control protein FliK [Sporosarcina koreensis]